VSSTGIWESRVCLERPDGFKTLVGDVAMGHVGAIFSLEASRLATSNQDWHRLLELCAISGTLVIDEDGIYNPAELNDGLALRIALPFDQHRHYNQTAA
jgi:DNA invertase Pin-like site-specific DNA recombinase